MSERGISEEFKELHGIIDRRITVQQGDVLIMPIDALPAGAGPWADTVLARGEATGHAHVALGEAVRVFQNSVGRRFLSAPNGARIVHEEHRQQHIPPGNYEIRIVPEYDHFAEETHDVWD